MHDAVEAIPKKAAANLIARFESKLEAKLGAMRYELNFQRCLLALIAAAIVQLFRSAARA